MHQFSPYRETPYCERSMQDTLASQIEQGMLYIALDADGVVGGIGGGVAPLFINKAYTMAYEQFWWVHEEYRTGRAGLRLLNRFIERSKELGCAYLMMMTLAKNDIGEFYERMGFEPFETGYVKRL
jgi:GNAT superfamily N-acetyltransferase